MISHIFYLWYNGDIRGLYMDRHTFKEKYKTSLIVGIASAVVVLGEVALCLFQYFNGVISIWNIAPLAMIVFIVFFNIKINKGNRAKSEEELVVVDKSAEEMDSNIIMNVHAPISGKQLLLRVVFMTVMVGLAILFYFLGVKGTEKYDKIVTATIIGQEYEIKQETTYEDGEVTTTETRINVFTLKYYIDGVEHTDTMTVNMGKVFTDTIQICVNDEGEFVQAYDKIKSWYTQSIVFAVAGVLMMLSMVFMLPMEFMVFDIMALIGAGLMILLNSSFLSNMLFVDMTAFMGLFLFLGLFGMIASIITKIIDR